MYKFMHRLKNIWMRKQKSKPEETDRWYWHALRSQTQNMAAYRQVNCNWYLFSSILPPGQKRNAASKTQSKGINRNEYMTDLGKSTLWEIGSSIDWLRPVHTVLVMRFAAKGANSITHYAVVLDVLL